MNRTKNSGVLEKTQPVFVGIDVHKKSWSVCVVQGDLVVGRCSMPGQFEKLEKYLNRFKDLEIHSCYEAGFLGFDLHFKLKSFGVNNSVIAPNKIPIKFGDYVKTDRKDSEKLAVCLAKKLITGIHIPERDDLDSRQLLRTREGIKRKRTRVIIQIKMLLYQYGITLATKGLCKKSTEEIAKISLPSQVKFCIDLYLEELEFLTKIKNQLDCQFKKTIKESPYATRFKLLQTMPGVGEVIAASLCFEVGDWGRFSNAKQFCAYFGLTPREFSSGEKVLKGRITRQGKGWIRGYLVESSWRLVANDPAMARYYQRIKANTGSGKKAIVAVARKMLCKLFSMVKHNQVYLPAKEAA